MFVRDSQDTAPRRRSAIRARARRAPEALKRELQDLERLHQATIRVARAGDWPTAANEILHATLTATGASKGLLSVCGEGEPGLTVAASAGFTPEFLALIRCVAPGAGACGSAFQRRTRIVVTDAATDPIFAAFRQAVQSGRFVSTHSVPLIAGGRPIGVLTVHYEETHQPDDREMWLMDLHASMAAGFLERARAVRAAFNSEDLREKMLAALPAGVYTTDAEGRILFFNQAARELWGRSPEPGVDRWCGFPRVLRPDGSVLPPDQRPMAVALREQRPVAGEEIVIERADGTRRRVMAYPEPLRDADGTLVGGVSMLLDVTRNRAAERDARLLAAIVEASHDAIISKDLDGNITSWNQSAERLFGYTAEEAIGRHITMLIPPDRHDEETRILRRIRAGERIEHFDTVRVRKDGSRLDISLTISPVRDANGRIVGASKIARDLSAFKQAQDALRTSEQQLRIVTDNAMIYLAHCDCEHRFKFVNRPYAERFGRAPAELVGLTVAEVIGPKAYEIVRPYLDAALAGQRVEFEAELPYERLGLRWMRVVHEPERTPNGEVVGLVAVITDITSRKRAEREMEETRDRAIAASRAKDEFLAALSHELRTPLNPVLLLASEAARDASLPARVRADFEVVRKNVELEARLIDDLLDLTRITQGKLALSLGTQPLQPILEDALNTIRPEIAQKSLAFTCDFAAGGALVRGDAVRLQQVLWNILKNAVKFTPDGGQITVRSWVDPIKRVAAVEVADSGIGMTAAELDRVFNAFAQGEHATSGGSHRFGGLGLGLAISKMLAELHDGSIRAESAGRDCGAQFVLELPLAAAPDRRSESDRRVGAAPPEGAPPPAAAGPPAGGHRRILLVEDHEPTRNALAQLLARRGHAVTACGTVAEARAAATQGAFDLLISDVGLPDGNGLELMAEMQRQGPEIAGIALTGYGMDHDLVRTQSAGFAVHLTKPVTIQSLDRALAATSLREPAR